MNQRTLLEMLTYRRPAWSRTEEEFIARYIDPVPGMYSDDFGNRILLHPTSKVMISCHTDTVHRVGGTQKILAYRGVAALPYNSRSNCLGADCTAGVYAALRMIEAGVAATFVFHRAEEIGGRGSDWLAGNYPEWVEQFDICLALDRRGTSDIITSQWGGPTASSDFAISLADALDMGHKPVAGVFTDSANYAHLIPECSNISVGYEYEHTDSECLDLAYLERLIPALCEVDWESLTVARDHRRVWADPRFEVTDEDLENYWSMKADQYEWDGMEF